MKMCVIFVFLRRLSFCIFQHRCKFLNPYNTIICSRATFSRSLHFFPLFLYFFTLLFCKNWSENSSFARVVLWDVLFFATSKNDQISAPRQVPIPSLGSFSSAWRDLYNGRHRCNVRRNFNGSTSSKSSIQMKCVLRVLRIFERFQGLRSLHYNELLTRA